MKKTLFPFFLLLAFMACQNKPTPPPTATNQVPMKAFLENYYEGTLQLFPFNATMQGDNRYNDQFPIEISDTYRAKVKAFYQNNLAELKKYDLSKLDDNDRTSAEILKFDLENNLEGLQFSSNLMPINQFDAMTLMLPMLGSGSGNQPFKTVLDYDNWLKRAAVFPAWADTAIVNMRRGIAAGWVLPQVLTKKVLPQLAEIAGTKEITKSTFYQPLATLPMDFSAADKARLTTAYKAMISTQILPSYQKLYDFMEKEYLPKSRATTGIGELPNGKAYYQWLEKNWTTTNMTPDEVFELGQKEVARIRSEMEKTKEQVGFKGDLKAFFTYINDSPTLRPFKKDAAVIENFNKIHERMKPQLAKLFDLVPKSQFFVRQTEAFRAASASAEYMQGSPDGTRPGIFYVPIVDAKKYNVFQDEALFLHEAIPGHHYQCSLQQENTDLPKFRRFNWYGAYGEGWALYTESLGKELGLYSDPYQYFGRLGMEMHRAIRLVVDAGMHTKGWTREQAIQYSLDNEAETEANTIAEIERYMAIPGQALSYKVGQLKIATLRQRAQEKMGDKFDIKGFHNEVLKYGCVPLSVLEQKIEAWMGKQ
jgi:uncharacterized protein (DUF885 family)